MSTSTRITRRELWSVIQKVKKEQASAVLKAHISSIYGTEELTEEQKIKISTFIGNFRKRYESVGRRDDRFLQRYSEWLDSVEDLGNFRVAPAPTVSAGPSSASGGRPSVPFDQSSERTKRRKTAALVESHSPGELLSAAVKTLRSAGQSDSASVVKEVTQTTPTRGSKIKQAWGDCQSKEVQQKYSEDEALALLIDLRLTKAKYEALRAGALKKNHELYPRYTMVLEAKTRCYARASAVTVTETSAEVSLQGLLDITSVRLLESLQGQDCLDKLNQGKEIHLLCKYGFDGCGSNAQYSQSFEEEGASDQHLFLSSLVPLQLLSDDQEVWKNNRANSTRFCRPIRIQFKKETPELTLLEQEYIQAQIDSLQPSSVPLSDNKTVLISHELILSMIDGKVRGVLSETASARCPDCKASPNEMNNLDNLQKKSVDRKSIMLGLSPLHAHIRMLEYLLHLSYRLHIEKWAVKGKESQDILKKRKEVVQERFRTEMGGLKVDFVQQGSGTTNSGNTARRVFANPVLSAEILGIDEEVVERFGVILSVISSSHPIHLKIALL